MSVVATPWDAYRLRANPFFQDELGGPSDPGAERLRELFVGREAERRLLGRLLLADEAARALVVGDPGVGKSSFVNRVKRDLTEAQFERGARSDIARSIADDAEGRDGAGPIEAPFITHAPAIEVQSAWSALDFTAEVLKVTLRMVRSATAQAVDAGASEGTGSDGPRAPW